MSIFKTYNPSVSFVFVVLAFLFGIAVQILVLFLVVELVAIITGKLRLKKIKAALEINPYVGNADGEGNFIYKQGGLTLKYRISSGPNGKIKPILVKQRLLPLEEAFRRIARNITDFLSYREWLCFFWSSEFLLLAMTILIYYFVFIEPGAYKDSRIRWLICRALKMDIADVEMEPEGWVRIWGERRTAVDHLHEPISYNFNPFMWLTFQDEGYIERWRGRPYGHVIHELEYNDYGDLWLWKDGHWRDGIIVKGSATWDKPQGTGIRAGKVLGHDLCLRERLSTDDK
ncbi:MAG: hypothetical protein ACOY3D_07840 [Candidatus Omnitrophota bacterium]